MIEKHVSFIESKRALNALMDLFEGVTIFDKIIKIVERTRGLREKVIK